MLDLNRAEFSSNLDSVAFKEAERVYTIGAMDMELQWWKKFWMRSAFGSPKVSEFNWHDRPLCQLFCWSEKGAKGEWCPMCPVYRDTWMHECNDFPEFMAFIDHIKVHGPNEYMCLWCHQLAYQVVLELRKIREAQVKYITSLQTIKG